jgi:hypothetical protein
LDTGVSGSNKSFVAGNIHVVYSGPARVHPRRTGVMVLASLSCLLSHPIFKPPNLKDALFAVMSRELEDDLLSSQALVNSAEGVELVLQ